MTEGASPSLASSLQNISRADSTLTVYSVCWAVPTASR